MAFMNADALSTADKAEINITPLVDVMLVLLIIFLVAAPMVVRQIELPLAASPPTPGVTPTVLALRIDAAGALEFEGRPLSLAALDRILQVEATRAELPVLQIDVSPDAAYARMAEVLSTARNNGMNRLELQTR